MKPRRAVNRVLGRLGFEMTRTPHMHSLEGHLRAEVQRLDVDCVLDVGANRGQFWRRMREVVGYGGRIVAFEPDSESFEELSRRAASDPRGIAVRLALGDAAGFATLKRFAFSSLNSLHEPNALAASHFADYEVDGAPATEPIGEDTVPIARLDQVLDAHAPEAGRILLKVDTQGHDAAVLDGAEGVLDRISAVLCEAPIQPIYDGVPDLRAILGQMAERGFRLGGAWPIDRTPDGVIVEVDAFFVRSRSLP